MKTFSRSLLVISLSLLSLFYCHASHLAGGEITVKRDPASSDPFSHILTLTLYRDVKGVDLPSATILFGDGASQSASASFREPIANDMERQTYIFRHTYPGAGTYTAAFTDEYRVAGIVNLSNSAYTPFHISTIFTISPSLGPNSTPVFLNPPIFIAQVGKRLCINAAAYDAEGDSLSYQLVVPLQRQNTPVPAYTAPNAVTPPGLPESGSGSPAFNINSLTGEICWDAPGPRKQYGGIITGINDFAPYTVAFQTEEWRNGLKISTTTSDFLITVRAPDAPETTRTLRVAETAGFNEDRMIRVEPGQRLSFPVTYHDSGNNRTTLLPVSETLLNENRAVAPVRDSAGYKRADYTWIPTVADQRSEPYLIVFRGGSFRNQNSFLYNDLYNDLTLAVFVGAELPSGRVTATEDEGERQQVKLYPNPTQSKVRLGIPPGGGAVRFRLINPLGQEIFSAADIPDSDPELDLSAVPAGLYTYILTSGRGIIGKGRLLKR